jgi:hypothetical protein
MNRSRDGPDTGACTNWTGGFEAAFGRPMGAGPAQTIERKN